MHHGRSGKTRRDVPWDTSVYIGGVRVDFVGEYAALEAVISAAREHRPLAIHFVNAYSVALAQRSSAFSDHLIDSDLNLPDGKPIAWIGRFRVSSASQVAGPDFMLYAIEKGVGLRHYFYGAGNSTVRHLARRIREQYRDAVIVGVESPPFRPLTSLERRSLIDRVASSGADVCWVGLGTPKQDAFIEDMRGELGIPLIGVGAAFDFHSGEKSRPPAWFRSLGLEWAYRLATEPRRLWRRYLVGNALFIWAVLRRGVQ